MHSPKDDRFVLRQPSSPLIERHLGAQEEQRFFRLISSIPKK